MLRTINNAFYLYYSDKYAVIESIIAEVTTELGNINESFANYSISDLVSGRATPIAANLVKYLSENKQVLKFLLGSTGVSDFFLSK